jgi:hypothetical protein
LPPPRRGRRGKYFPITTIPRLIAHTRLTFLLFQSRAAAATSSAAGTDTVGIDPDSKTKTNPSLGIDPAPMDTPDDDDIDPLDLFMAQNNAKADKMVADAAAKEAELGNKSASQKPGAVAALAGGVVLKPVGGFFKHSLVRKNALTLGTRQQGLGAPVVRRFRDDESDADESDDDSDDDKNSSDNDASDSDAEWSAKQHGKLSKAEKLGITDHTTVEYPPFRKNFYIESFEIARMSSEDVAALRTELDGIRCRGNNPPRPVKTWAQCGLSNRVSELIRRSGFEKPSPIQCQALPVIMSGRDCVGVAKTGSGKTLAYILPMLRHCKDQDPLRRYVLGLSQIPPTVFPHKTDTFFHLSQRRRPARVANRPYAGTRDSDREGL